MELKEQDTRMWTGFIWLRTGPGGRLFWQGMDVWVE